MYFSNFRINYRVCIFPFLWSDGNTYWMGGLSDHQDTTPVLATSDLTATNVISGDKDFDGWTMSKHPVHISYGFVCSQGVNRSQKRRIHLIYQSTWNNNIFEKWHVFEKWLSKWSSIFSRQVPSPMHVGWLVRLTKNNSVQCIGHTGVSKGV